MQIMSSAFIGVDVTVTASLEWVLTFSNTAKLAMVGLLFGLLVLGGFVRGF